MITSILALYFITIFLACRTNSPFHFFVFIATTLQFLPLFLPLINGPAMFWHQERYILPYGNDVFLALCYILASSLAGFSLSSLISSNNRSRSNYYKDNSILLTANSQISPFLVFGTLIFGAALILTNSLTEKDVVFTGYHLTVSLLISTGFVFYLIRRSNSILILSLTLLSIYIIEQLGGGDRDFATIVIALALYLTTFSRLSQKKRLLVTVLLLATFSASVFVSAYRQDITIDLNALLSRIYFNSWSGIIKPLIELLLEEGIPRELLYGKTYFYAIVSAPPSFIFDFAGANKPFEGHNPAHWYSHKTNGGMHILGVALKNLSLAGVFIQSFALGIGATFLENIARKRNTFCFHLLYIAVATAILKTLWYSPLNLINAFTFWAIFCAIILGAQRFLSICTR